MKLVLQPTPETCGQACIAMITGKDINEVIHARLPLQNFLALDLTDLILK